MLSLPGATCVIIYFNPIFCLKLSSLIWRIVRQIYYILIFHYYTIILITRLSIIFGLSFEDIYLSFGIYLSCSFVTVSEFFCCEFLKFFVIPPSYDFFRTSISLLFLIFHYYTFILILKQQ